MTELVDTDGEFPKYRISAREEVVAIFDAHAKEALAEKAKSLPGDYEANLAKLTKHAEHFLPDLRDSVSTTAEKGFILKSTIESYTETLLFRTGHRIRIHDRIEEIDRQAASRLAREAESFRPTSPAIKPPSANRWLWGAGVATGGALLVHGTTTAATAVSPNDHRRDWRKTALHTAEAIAGLALTWVSIVKLKTSASPAL